MAWRMTARGVCVSILEMLEPPGKVVTAEEIATRCEVSVRTIYRRIEALKKAGIPIASERGFGFVLQVRRKGSLGADISMLLLKRFPRIAERAGDEEVAAAAAGIGQAVGGLLAAVMMRHGMTSGRDLIESIAQTASKQAVSIIESIAAQENTP